MEKEQKEAEKISRGNKPKNCDRHHYNPRSRISFLLSWFNIIAPSKEIIRKIYAVKVVDARVHACWHALFSNFFAWEAIEQIRLWSTDDLSDIKIFFKVKQKNAWQTVFGSATPKEAIEIIKQEWWPEYPPIEDILREGQK